MSETSYVSRNPRDESARKSILNAREVIRRSVSKTREKGFAEEPMINMSRKTNRHVAHAANFARRDNSV